MTSSAAPVPIGRGDITVHGFRSVFRHWAPEQTSSPHETCEHALAHPISGKAEADRHGDKFEERRKLMQASAEFCLATDVENLAKFRLQ